MRRNRLIENIDSCVKNSTFNCVIGDHRIKNHCIRISHNTPFTLLIIFIIKRKIPHFLSYIKYSFISASWFKWGNIFSLIAIQSQPIHETSSYCPISLLPTLSKLFEKLLTNRLLPLLKDLKTLPDHQFGFRKQHSTIEQIHRITHNISQALKKKKILLSGIPWYSTGIR